MKILFLTLIGLSSFAQASERHVEASEVRMRKKVALSIDVPAIKKIKISPSVEVRYKVKKTTSK